MVVSLNTKAYYKTKANSLTGSFGSKHGDILIGDKAFEFYNYRNSNDYIQIPWEQIKRVRVQIYFKDKYIRGFFIDTKNNGTFNFVVKNAGKSLKIMRDFIGEEQIVRNKPLITLKGILKNLMQKIKR